MPVAAQHLQVRPVPDREAGRVRRAQRHRLRPQRALDRHVEHVGHELHEQVVRRHPAVDLQPGDGQARVGVHRVDDLARLPPGGLQHRAGQVAAGDVGGQPDHDAAGLRVPARRVQPGERRHDVAAAVVRHARRQRLDLRGRGDHPERVAEPLHQRPGHRDRALERVAHLVAEHVADGRDQAVGRARDPRPGVHQQERARAVRALGLARGEARLPDERGLLVAQRPGDRAPRAARWCTCRRPRVRPDLGQHPRRDVERFSSSGCPLPGSAGP